VTPERWVQVKEVLYSVLELEPDQRSAYLDRACGNDPLLRREVESLLHHEIDDDFLKTIPLEGGSFPDGGATHSLVGRSIGPYRIVEEIGAGGMGEVFRAVRADDQYKKEVAIKVVRRAFDTDSGLRRFKAERQILASLDHANIARLLDSGTTEDGLPYVVMELVEGKAIDEYCDGHDLSLVDRLKLFRLVCAAVHYAHQHLVVHRDLKPSNILVTEEGVPKLLDFGIAKLLAPEAAGQPSDRTATLMRVMTPEFASPEQVRGEHITTASDVYSLGVVLYRLLTGCSPYRTTSGVPHEIAREICESDPEKPSIAITHAGERTAGDANSMGMSSASLVSLPSTEQETRRLRRRLAGDLDNIVLMALRKEPLRRYASVAEFSDDIRRHLEGLPVAARKDTLGYRTGKFVTRHKLGVGAAVLALLLLLAGMAAIVREARIAEANRQRAERRFNDVRKLANSFMFELHDSIQNLPGSTAARELVVKRALEYLDGLSQEAGDDASLRRELATAYEKVGDVQGSPYRSNLGNLPGALVSYRKALELREQLSGAAPRDQQLQLELARSYGEVGESLQVSGDIGAAMEDYRKAFVLLSPLTDPAARRELSVLHVRYGKAWVKSGDLAKALENHQAAIAITDELLKKDPHDRALWRAQAFAYISMSDTYQDMGQFQKELAGQRMALSLLEPLAEPNNAQSRRDVGVAQSRTADTLSQMGDKRGALAIQLKALAEDEAAAKIDPSNALARRDVYIDYYKSAFLLSALGEMQAAMVNQRKCIALCEAEVAANPASAENRGNLGVAYFRYGEMLEKTSQGKQALQYYEKAVAIDAALSDADPKDTEKRGDLSESVMKLSDAYLQLGDAESALAGYRKALGIREGLVAGSPDNVEGRSQLARLYEKLGGYYAAQAAHKSPRGQRARNWREAKRWYQQSLAVWNDLQQHKTIAADYAKKPGEVLRQLEKCDAAVAQLHE
jgi:serine/threonine protein kinase/tetratricopeptide (TPR) repeat protein